MDPLLQSADLIITSGSTTTRLMLAQRNQLAPGQRAWTREKVNRRAARTAISLIEDQLVWDSWHMGVGYGRYNGVERMPPVAAEGDADTRYEYLCRLPPKRSSVTGSMGTSPVVYLIFEHAGFIWAAGTNSTGGQLWKINTSTLAIDATTALGATAVPYSVAIFDGIAYIGVGFSDNAWKISAAASVSQSSDADVRWKYLAASRDKLYFSTAATVIQSVATGADPFTDTNWSGALTTGNTNQDITSMAVLGRVLYIMRKDGLVAFDQDLNVVNVLPDLAANVNAGNGVAMIPWHGGLLISHTRGLYWYQDGLVMNIGPERNKNNTTNVRGQFSDLAADGEWVWGLMALAEPQSGGGTSTKLYLMAGRERSDGEQGTEPMVWHHLANVSGVESAPTHPTGLCVSSLNGNRLWFGISGGVRVITLPTNNAPPYDPGTGDFETSGSLVLPDVSMDAPMVDKYLKSVEVDVENAGASQTVQVSYALNPVDSVPTFTNLGAAISSSGRTERSFPTNTSARTVRLKLTLAGTATESPVVRRVALNYMERPDKNTVLTAICRVGRDIQDRNGNDILSTAGPNDVLTNLYAYEADDASAVTVNDPTGRLVLAQIVETKTEEVHPRTDAHDMEFLITLTMVEVP